MPLPPSLPAAAFEAIEFWDARYSVDERAFDWYERPSIGVAMAAVETALEASAACSTSTSTSTTSSSPPLFSLLDIGCGTSLLAERISEEKKSVVFGRIVACDASEVAVERQRRRQEERRAKTSTAAATTAVSVSYEIADAFCLPYADSSFDAVVDKGTADALDCGGCGENENEGGDDENEVDENGRRGGGEKKKKKQLPPPAARVIAEASRVLRPGGVFVMVSCREPQRRRKDFARAGKIVSTSSPPTATRGDERRLRRQLSSLVLSSVVGEIRKAAKDPCPNAHVYVAIKPRIVFGNGEKGGEQGEKEVEEKAEAAARELADAAAKAASLAADAALSSSFSPSSATTTES